VSDYSTEQTFLSWRIRKLRDLQRGELSLDAFERWLDGVTVAGVAIDPTRQACLCGAARLLLAANRRDA